ncbi:VCBS repeat-containing protein [Nannocystis sp. ILAH1]|uniref:FG-GAP repeat domain-containing protein n=1 Tax=Nannocystis sp. ILAH1 TaxID=2996789 RepID=UPI00226FE29C|nr:VCBS repeat-containing protein [Nannocystis sp. ILAH1]MCY0993968.1 VCBS repeat-containing protein [Nannocystis sp. ILAH1]
MSASSTEETSSTAAASGPTDSSSAMDVTSDGSDPYSDTVSFPGCGCQIGAEMECEVCGGRGVRICDWYDADACDYGPCELVEDGDPCPAGWECGDGECHWLQPLRACERQAMTSSELTLAGPASTVALADFDDDGVLDLLAALPDDAVVELRFGDGAGGFGPGAVFPTGMSSEASRMAIADLNGDGRPDVVSTAPSAVGELSLVVNQGGVFAAPLLSTLGVEPQQLFAGDFDGDGFVDVLARSTPVLAELAFRTGDGMGGVGPEVVLDESAVAVFPIGAGKVAGGQQVDIVSTAHDPQGAEILELVDGALKRVATITGHGEVRYQEVSVGDIDGDGTEDVALYREIPSLAMVRAWAQGVNEELSLPWKGQLGPIADVDGDGRGDLLIATAGPPGLGVVYFAASCVQDYTLANATSEVGLASGDIDGDGKADVVVATVGSSQAIVLRTGP